MRSSRKEHTQKPQRRIRSSEAVFDILLAKVLTLELAPGLLVRESELSDLTGGSRSVVHDALARLQDTGLVSVVPRTGVVIAPIAVADVQNVFEARRALETELAMLVARRASDAEIQQLAARSESLDAMFARLTHAADGPGFVEADRAFHMYMAAIAQNPLLERAYAPVVLTNSRLMHYLFTICGPGLPELEPHHHPVEAIRNRDPAGARDAVLLDISRGQSLYWNSLAQRGALEVHLAAGNSSVSRKTGLVAHTSLLKADT